MGRRPLCAARCPGCGLHRARCLCPLRPRLELADHLLVVQHPLERFKPTNTARMLLGCLGNASLVWADDRARLAEPRALVPRGPAVLLFRRSEGSPGGAPARPASAALPAAPGPITLVLLDGTWAQCSRLARRWPALRALAPLELDAREVAGPRLRHTPDPARCSSFQAGACALGYRAGPAVTRALMAWFELVVAELGAMRAGRVGPVVPDARGPRGFCAPGSFGAGSPPGGGGRRPRAAEFTTPGSTPR